MKRFRLLLLLLSIISFNVYASNINPNNHHRMCVSAYLANPIHVGDVTFYVKDQPIGNISIYGASTNVITILDNGYFKGQQDFEANKAFLSVEMNRSRLTVTNFTYQSC